MSTSETREPGRGPVEEPVTPIPHSTAGESECEHALTHLYEYLDSEMTPDDELRIRHTIQTWADQGDVDWIVTTGGTGFGVRDRTPEVRSLCVPATESVG